MGGLRLRAPHAKPYDSFALIADSSSFAPEHGPPRGSLAGPPPTNNGQPFVSFRLGLRELPRGFLELVRRQSGYRLPWQDSSLDSASGGRVQVECLSTRGEFDLSRLVPALGFMDRALGVLLRTMFPPKQKPPPLPLRKEKKRPPVPIDLLTFQVRVTVDAEPLRLWLSPNLFIATEKLRVEQAAEFGSNTCLALKGSLETAILATAQ